MDVDIIIVNFNTKELIRNCLKSIYEKTEGVDYRICVVDNASTDGSSEMIKNEFPQVELVVNTENIGFGGANNLAMSKSNAEYIFLLNPDTFLINNVIKICYDFMELEENKNVGICGGNVFRDDMSPHWAYGHFPSLRQAMFDFFELKYLFKKYYFQKIKPICMNADNIIKEVDFISGADMFIRKSVLDEVGLFDEDFFLYYEETELSYRVHKKGYKSILVPEAKIVHLSELETHNVKKLALAEKSKYMFYKKSYGKKCGRMCKNCFG